MTIGQIYQKMGQRKYRHPEQLCKTEWRIIGKESDVDRRVHTELVVSYGNQQFGGGTRGIRDVSLRIDNRVVILDALNQNALILLLMMANTAG